MTELDPPQVILVSGGTGAGKTTYARQIAEKLSAIRFSADDWLRVLFEPDRPEDADFTWYSERHARIGKMIRSVAAQLLDLGIPVVLDLGFTGRAQRSAEIQWARHRGAEPRIHYLDIDAGVRWERVQKRNHERGDTFALEVTREMFDFMETRYEIPSEDEAPVTRVS